MSRKKLNGLVRRDWEIPERMLRIARDRVSPYLRNLQLYNYDLRAVLEAAYLQGVEDCGIAVFGKENRLEIENNLGAGI